VWGVVKPGAPFEKVVRDCPKLARDADVLVVMAGTNNVSSRRRIDFQALQHQLSRLRLSTRVILTKRVRIYLTNRSQIVEIEANMNSNISKHFSRESKILKDVPQGSVLGPLLFIHY
jgi:hypothetical protein